MAECKVSISVVTYNSGSYIKTFMDSIFDSTTRVPFHVYVVDNNSNDNTKEIIRNITDNRLTLISNNKNCGYGRAHNQVINKIHSKYHVIANPDVKLTDNVIDRLCDYLDSNEDIAIVTPKILFPDGTLQILPKADPKLIYQFARRLPFSFLQKYRKQYEMTHMGVDSPFNIEFCSGSFMFIRTDVLKKVGGFDERYYMYFEDADLTREIRKYGRAQYNPAFIIYHKWERLGKKKLKFLLIQISSMIKYIYKWKWLMRKTL